MGGQQDVAVLRGGGGDRVHPRVFQIARQQDPPPLVGDGQHDAVGVVHAAFDGGVKAAAGRMQDVDHGPAAGQAISLLQRGHRHPRGGQLAEQFPDTGAVVPPHRLRDVYDSQGKPFQQLGHRVEVVGIGMADQEGIDVGETA